MNSGEIMDTVVLLGMGPTALTALESLAPRFQVACLIHDAGPAATDEVIERARALAIPVLSDLSIDGVEQAVARSNPDCVVVSSYDRILPSRILGRCRFANVHYAPL